MRHRVVVAGGDARDVWLCRFLMDQQFDVLGWGLASTEIEKFSAIASPPDILIGPMTGIGPHGAMETREGIVYLESYLLERMPPGSLLGAGLIAPDVKDWARRLDIATVEYRMQPTFMWLNAVPTAEGAIKAALGRSGFTIYHRPLAILGFGRVGSVLALRLQSYGADVEIFERSAEKRAMASAYGFGVHPLDPEWCPPVDGIFNTIPAPIMGPRWFDVSEAAWVIDLASKPGGLAFSLRDNPDWVGRYESILGIPGQLAPRRAAEIIWETLSEALLEHHLVPKI